MSDNLLAPFPWFGGKSRVAGAVWQHFGDVDNYVEPFAGSLAVMLGRPATHARKAETVNDMDNYLANFWRACQADPDAVARWADWPANETDMHARHLWLVNEGRERLANLVADPFVFDAQVAGWWVWGINLWIGSGWCSGNGAWGKKDGQLVHLSDAVQGVDRKRVHLGNAGRGINRQLIHLGDAVQGVDRKRVHLGNAGRGEHLTVYMRALADRLRNVRVCCGDWSRIVTFGALSYGATVGVFLDPPYHVSTGRDMTLYNHETDVSTAVREWALANADNPRYRIALCGYAGEHDMPGWDEYRWKAGAAYKTSRGDQTGNGERERIWFSPNCLRLPLFGGNHE